MITLYQLAPAHNLPTSVSPYCTKLEVYFRLTGREYETKAAYIPKSPNKRVPYVGGVGEGLMADSEAIIGQLESEGPMLDDGLSAEDKASGDALVTAVQRDLYFACLYSRFVEPDGWVFQRAAVKALVPWILAPILVPMIRKSQVKATVENGFADPEAGYKRATETAQRVADALGDKPYLFGEEPRIADCAVWANTMQNAYTPSDNPARAAVRSHDNLMAYIARLAERVQLTMPALP